MSYCRLIGRDGAYILGRDLVYVVTRDNACAYEVPGGPRPPAVRRLRHVFRPARFHPPDYHR